MLTLSLFVYAAMIDDCINEKQAFEPTIDCPVCTVEQRPHYLACPAKTKAKHEEYESMRITQGHRWNLSDDEKEYHGLDTDAHREDSFPIILDNEGIQDCEYENAMHHMH